MNEYIYLLQDVFFINSRRKCAEVRCHCECVRNPEIIDRAMDNVSMLMRPLNSISVTHITSHTYIPCLYFFMMQLS